MAKPSRKNSRSTRRARAPRPTSTRANTAEATPAPETTPAPEATSAPEATFSYTMIPDMAGPSHKADRENFLYERRLKPGNYQPVAHQGTSNRITKPGSMRITRILGYIDEVQDQMRKREWEVLNARWAGFGEKLAEHEKDLAEGREQYRRYLAACEESERGVEEKVRQILGGTGSDNGLENAGDKVEEE